MPHISSCFLGISLKEAMVCHQKKNHQIMGKATAWSTFRFQMYIIKTNDLLFFWFVFAVIILTFSAQLLPLSICWGLRSFFRWVGQERISIRGSVRPSVRRPSVRPLRLCKNRVSRLFLAIRRTYTETNDPTTCFESLLYYSVVSPVCSSTVRTHRCRVGLV